MKPDADLTLVGVGRIVTEFLEAAGLNDVTLCFNDWCGAQVMIADGGMERVGKLVLVSCETAGNYPPGLAGFAARLSAKLPGGYIATRALLLQLRLRRLPFVFGQMTKRGVPNDLMRDWMEPLRKREIRPRPPSLRGRRDARQARPGRASAALPSFERPVLLVWDAEGKMMPNEAGRALAGCFPDSRYVELPDCYTLVPEDQPEALAREIRRFAR
jgi:pimeloyl-ACP methyl ester carboxylesterase